MAKAFQRFRGYDSGTAPSAVTPDMSPNCRNWINTDGVLSLHGPRKSSEAFRDNTYSAPIGHVHTWVTRNDVPIISAFVDDGSNLQLHYLRGNTTESTGPIINFTSGQALGSPVYSSYTYYYRGKTTATGGGLPGGEDYSGTATIGTGFPISEYPIEYDQWYFEDDMTVTTAQNPGGNGVLYYGIYINGNHTIMGQCDVTNATNVFTLTQGSTWLDFGSATEYWFFSYCTTTLTSGTILVPVLSIEPT